MSRRSPGLTPYEANVFARRGNVGGLDFSGLGGFSGFNAVAPLGHQAAPPSPQAAPQAEQTGVYNLAFYTFRIPTPGIWRIDGAFFSEFHKWFRDSSERGLSEKDSYWSPPTPAKFIVFLGAFSGSAADAERLSSPGLGYVGIPRAGLLFVLAESEPTVTFVTFIKPG